MHISAANLISAVILFIDFSARGHQSLCSSSQMGPDQSLTAEVSSGRRIGFYLKMSMCIKQKCLSFSVTSMWASFALFIPSWVFMKADHSNQLL